MKLKPAEGFQALSDPTRLSILERVAREELPAGKIARDFPVTRTAISQHLTVLRQAGMLLERREGTRRLYRIDPSTIAALRGYLDALTQEGEHPSPSAAVPEQAKTAPHQPAPSTASAVPAAPARSLYSGQVRLELSVAVAPDRVFALWSSAEGLRRWMAPLAEVDDREGGSIRLSNPSGVTIAGQLECYLPPTELAFGWGGIDGLEEAQSRVRLQFIEEGEGTRVQLTHDHLPPRLIPTYRNLWRHSALPRLKAAAEGLPVDGLVLQPPA